jgi:hypothetical protein
VSKTYFLIISGIEFCGLMFDAHTFDSFDIFLTRCNITQFIYFWKTAVRVPGGISTHPQEHTTVFTVSGTCQTVTATCRY